MRRVILYGAGEFTKKFLCQNTEDYIVLGVADRNWKRIGCICGHKVISPTEINELDYEYVVIALDDLKYGNDQIIFEIYNDLKGKGVPEEKIILQSFKSMEHHINRFPRKVYLQELSALMYKSGIEGDVAECGVYRGWFSSMINEAFPDKRMWLFDTFEGFDQNDVDKDTEEAKESIRKGEFDRFNYTSEEIVRLRCMHRDKLIIRKGYVPDTFQGIETTFCFVNLDMDLYVPQLAALKFFAPRMEKNGVILVHDYYNKIFTGTTKAVDEFCESYKVTKYPIGDGLSIALLFD